VHFLAAVRRKRRSETIGSARGRVRADAAERLERATTQGISHLQRIRSDENVRCGHTAHCVQRDAAHVELTTQRERSAKVVESARKRSFLLKEKCKRYLQI
jgi:hypothetical protein